MQVKMKVILYVRLPLLRQTQFQKQGGTIKDEEKVTNIVPGEVVVVYTSKDVYRAKSIVITPGPWASKLLRPLGLNLPLEVSSE